jgi:immune inhibitor A
MKARLFTCCRVLAILAIVAAIPIAIPGSVATTTPAAKTVESLGMFSVSKWTAHYRAPNIEQIETLLTELGIPMPDAQAREAAVATFRQKWAERNPTTPNPEKLRALLEKERQGKPGPMAAEAAAPQIMSLAVPVEFPNSDTFDWCGESVTTEGPLHNQIPPPGPRDNNTIWYEDATPELYNELYFGVGPDAGVIVNHPNLGTVDLRGNTMANYFLEQSEGAFVPKGEVYPKWLQAVHSEGWYGADSEAGDPPECGPGGNHNVRAADLVREVVDGVNADNASFAWQDYDGDANGVVDNFTVIHAGMGQESGGGLQGIFSIWSHASAINLPTGYLACTMGSAGCPDRDIYVREYSMDPEALDVGVIAEEFGHAAFGLPDIYTTDYQASPSNWTIFEAGSWNGPLMGMQPAPFPLVFRYMVGWAKPVELDYSTDLTYAKVGQLSLRPEDTEQGIKINLPDQVIDTPNPLGTGKAWWSDRADVANFYLAHDFDLAGTTAPIFSFASYWSFEEDYDYGYVEVSDDGGATWTKLPDMDGIFVDDGLGNLGLNGEGQGTLRFDLAAYAGKTISLRLLYTSDVGVQWAGWFADDFSLDDGATNLFTDDVENPPNGWTTNHFVIVPLTRIYPMYYMAEWRNDSGFDRGLKYPYQTVYNNDATNEWEVDRCAHTVPGMLLWLRNGARDFDYTLSDSWYDPPSLGPKHALLVVDSHYWPMAWSDYQYSSGANLRITTRCQPANATFTLQPTTPFTIRLGYDPATGQYVDTPLETKTFEALPAVSQYHDSLGYYPGLWYRPATGGLYFWQPEASAVVPAKDNYSTRITNLDKTPATDLYGADLGFTVLGTGNPRDDKVQYGLNIAVLDKAKDGSWGKIAVWNATSLADLEMKVNREKAYGGNILMYQLKVRNVSPAPQKFMVSDTLPENTTYLRGGGYDKVTNTVTWEGTVEPNEVKVTHMWVRVNAGAERGTEIVNTATLTDDANGDSASATTTVMKSPPKRGIRADVRARR